MKIRKDFIVAITMDPGIVPGLIIIPKGLILIP